MGLREDVARKRSAFVAIRSKGRSWKEVKTPLTSTSVTRSLVILPAASLPKVADGTELGPEGLASIPPIRQVLNRRPRLELPLVPGVDVADEVVADVVADMELEEVAELGELAEYGEWWEAGRPEKEATGELGQSAFNEYKVDRMTGEGSGAHEHVLVERIKVILQLLRAEGAVLVVPGVLVDVVKQDGLRVDGLLVLSRAAVSVSAGTDLNSGKSSVSTDTISGRSWRLGRDTPCSRRSS